MGKFVPSSVAIYVAHVLYGNKRITLVLLFMWPIYRNKRITIA